MIGSVNNFVLRTLVKDIFSNTCPLVRLRASRLLFFHKEKLSLKPIADLIM